MSYQFGVLTGMGPGQTPTYHVMVLPGPDPYAHLEGAGCEDIQRQLGLVGDYYNTYPQEITNPMNTQYVVRGDPAGNQTGDQSSDPWLGNYYNTHHRR